MIITKNLIPALFLGIAFLLSCKSEENKIRPGDKPKAPPTPKVDGYIVSTHALSDNATLPGTIIANEATEIHPEISGRLTYLNVAEGRTVGQGTVIAKIYDGDLQAQLRKLEIQLKQAQVTVKRYEELVKIDGVSRQEYDMQMLNINTIKADMNIVHSNLQRTIIRAPFSGTLGLKNISPGSYVTPATAITTIRQNSRLKLDFTLPEKYAGKLSNGQLVSFTIAENPKTYNAQILASEMGINEADRSMQVRALVTNNDGKILPGAFVKVQTNFDPNPNAIMIPTQAVIPQARGKKVAVYRGGTISFDNVETGIRDTSMVQITSGLKVGDTIIVSGIMTLKPGGKVELKKVQN